MDRYPTSLHLTAFLARLAHENAVLVRVIAAAGSVPRDPGAWIAVFPDAVIGNIGGGRLEYDAIARARALLRRPWPGAAENLRFALGPALGQCCGGTVELGLEAVGAADAGLLATRLCRPGRAPVALFGGGHVGHALARVLAALPFELSWIDSRDGVFPQEMPGNVACEHSAPVHAAVRTLASGSCVVIMSFSHAEDFDILAACLQRQRAAADLSYIGLIGSKSKWAGFRRRLEARGFADSELAQVTSPIGLAGIHGKEPEVIAVSVAAQLLLRLQQS